MGGASSTAPSLSSSTLRVTSSGSWVADFRFVYFLLAGFGSSASVAFFAVGRPLLPLFEGSGVTPPLAAFAAASRSALSLAVLSRFDMMPSFGGRPGPRRFGFPSGPRGGWAGGGGVALKFLIFTFNEFLLPMFGDAVLSMLDVAEEASARWFGLSSSIWSESSDDSIELCTGSLK